MNGRYETAVFDLDGTLLDTLGDLTDSVNAALREFSLPEREIGEIRRFVGNGIKNLICRAVPENSDEELTGRVFKFFSEYYGSHCRIKTAPYDGIIHMLENLRRRGIKIAVVSNKADAAVKMLCRDFFGDLTNAAVGENEAAGIRKKPAPDEVYEAFKIMKSDMKNAVYIGDSEVDVKTAAACGLPCISVCWGFRSEQELKNAGAKIFCKTPSELEQMLI